MQTYISGLSATQTKKKKDKKNGFGFTAEPKQKKLNVAFLIDAFLCQTSLLLQKQWTWDVALKNAFLFPILMIKMCPSL